jgi:two-component system cell cycle response regulator
MPSSFPSRPADRAASTHAEEAILVMQTTTLPPRIADSLKAAGFALVAVEAEDAALRFMADSVPAAVLLGWSAVKDPYHLVRRIRTREHLAFVQVVVLTSNPEGLTMGQAIMAGADDCMDVSRIEAGEIVDCILSRISRARAQAELALLDPLTGLHNRRFMNDRLPAEIARAGREGAMLSLALIDLDDFKQVNDTFGHTAGDRVLASFAHVLSSSFRSYDMTCRFGGDEFIVLFPDCDAGQAALRLDELRRRLTGIVSDPPVPGFTAGIATCPQDGTSWGELFESADSKLRERKDSRARGLGRSMVSPRG